MMSSGLVALIGACVLLPCGVRAQENLGRATAGRGASQGQAVRAARAPLIDGRGDDAAWASAPPLLEFRQFAPAEDGDPSFRTEARVAFDERNLYVLVRAFDPYPDSIVALLSRRDVSTNSDRVKIIIDGYLDRRTGIEMSVNAAGVKIDASIYNDQVEDITWDGVWDAATRIDSLGWTAEFRVPLSQIRFNPGATAFGFGVWRDIARRNERDAWPLYRTSRQALASQLGVIEGLLGITSSRRLELLPYSLTKNVTEANGSAYRHPQQLTAGLDLKAGLTPNVTLDATVNPDFGQVEADPSVLNLTAFEVKFEERRPFFQEGVGLFKCAPCEGAFYTRRIGRAPQLGGSSGDPASTRILGAAKLTGHVSHGFAFGLVEALTRREVGAGGTTIEPRTNYLIGRLVREMRDGRSQLGVITTATNRELDAATEPFLRREAYTALVQGLHRFARDEWELMAYSAINRVHGSAKAIALTQLNSVHLFQRPDHERHFDSTLTSLGGTVSGMSISKIAGRINWFTFIRRAEAGPELNDLGFSFTMNDFGVSNALTVQTFTPGTWYRHLLGHGGIDQHWTLGGLPSSSLAYAYGSVEWLNSWITSLTYQATDIGRVYCVACARGGPAVRQSLKHQLSTSVTGDQRRAVTPVLNASVNVSKDGASRGYALRGQLDVRVASRFSMSVGPDYSRNHDDQQWVGNFGAALSDTTHFTFARLNQTTVGVTTRANWTVSPTLSFQLYMQPFISTGRFTNWRELSAPRAPRYADRYQPYGAGDPLGFNFKQFNSNAVIRWEYRPGSVLFVVWQQGRLQDERNPGSFQLGRDSRDLFQAHPDNTVLVKLSYWLSP